MESLLNQERNIIIFKREVHTISATFTEASAYDAGFNSVNRSDYYVHGQDLQSQHNFIRFNLSGAESEFLVSLSKCGA